MPIRKKDIKAIQYPIIGRKNELSKANSTKGTLCGRMKISTILCNTNFTNTMKKKSANRNGYHAYKNLKRLNNKISNLSDNLEDTYCIIVGTNHPKCAEPPNPIVKYANCNRNQFKIVYQFIK